MTRVVEADEKGGLHLSAEWLNSKPHARYMVEFEGERVILRPSDSAGNAAAECMRTPQQRAEAFLKWVGQQRAADVHLTDEQLRRENIYE